MKELSIRCGARDHVVSLTKMNLEGDEDAVYLSLFEDLFYSEQTGLIYRLWERIKLSAAVLFGKSYQLYDVVIEPEHFKEISDFFSDKEG